MPEAVRSRERVRVRVRVRSGSRSAQQTFLLTRVFPQRWGPRGLGAAGRGRGSGPRRAPRVLSLQQGRAPWRSPADPLHLYSLRHVGSPGRCSQSLWGHLSRGRIPSS